MVSFQSTLISIVHRRPHLAATALYSPGWTGRQPASQSKQAPNQHIIHHKNGSKPLSKIDIVAASGDDTALCTGHERIDIDPVTMAGVLVLLDYSIMWVVRHFYAASSAAVASPRRNYMDPFHNAAFLLLLLNSSGVTGTAQPCLSHA